MSEIMDSGKPKIIVSYKKHRFKFYFTPENSTIEFSIDSEKKRYKVREIIDNRIYFKETIEIFVGYNDVEFVDYLELNDEEYSSLKEEQNIISAKIEQELETGEKRYVENMSKEDLLSMVDKHTRKVKKMKTIRDGKKQTEKYVIHNFSIGAANICLIERNIDGKVLINPDYKIRSNYDKVGGVAAKDGDVYVWKYYFETKEPSDVNPEKKKGYWKTARVMRYSEQICCEIISRYGELANK